MERIGVRELRQHASRWLARVAAGESFEVTEHGRLVALLVPPKGGVRERMIASGRLRPAAGDLMSVRPVRRARSLSADLEKLRAEER
jgi:prevent-host-death family protein